MAMRSRYSPDESSCNQLYAGKELLLAGCELQLKLLKTWHFLSVGNTNIKKNLVLRCSLKTTFFCLYISLWKEITHFRFGFSQIDHWPLSREVPTKMGPYLIFYPSIARPSPGAQGTLPSSLSAHLMQEALSLDAFARIGLSDSWLRDREPGSYWAYSRLTDRRWASVWYLSFA